MIQVTRKEFEQYVDEALARIPESFHQFLANVCIEVVDTPGTEDFDEAGTDVIVDILGIYIGCPLTEKSVSDSMTMPDRIHLFQDNIQSICDTREELINEIRLTVLHEVGHHFGLDEDQLTELGYE